jgi:group I intron endonuclease
MKTGIYKITSPTNRIYIGQAVDLDRRYKSYRKYNEKRQIRLYRSIAKYGFLNHKWEIIELCNKEDLNKRERYWQDYYNVIGKQGLNSMLTNSEDLPREMSISSSIKQANTRGISLKDCLSVWEMFCKGVSTTEIRKSYPKISYKVLWKIKTGQHWVNKYLKEKRGINFSDYETQIPYNRFSEEQKKRALDLYYNQDKTLKEVSEIMDCNTITMSSVLNIKKRKPSRKPQKVLQFDKLNNLLKEWNSANEASEILGIAKSGIISACNKTLKTLKNYIWEYKK